MITKESGNLWTKMGYKNASPLPSLSLRCSNLRAATFSSLPINNPWNFFSDRRLLLRLPMPQPSLLPPLLLCTAILLPIVASQQQSPSNAGNSQSPPPPPPPPPPSRRSTPFFAREFLSAHNKVRMNVTHPLLNWDRKLARYARRWGMKRVADCKMIHSYGPYGENLFWGALDHWTPTEAVESWSKEKQFYNPQNNACSEGEMCGHYTQIIWKDSIKLGCTRVKCQTGGVLMICEYDPPGNYVNESPFATANGGATATASVNPNFLPSPPSNESTGSPHRKMADGSSKWLGIIAVKADSWEADR